MCNNWISACWVPTKWVHPPYWSCGPCACKLGKPVLMFSWIFQWLLYKAHDRKHVSYNFLIALKRTVLWMKSLVSRVFFELTPAFPENSLAQGLQQQLSLLGTERVKCHAHVLISKQNMRPQHHTSDTSHRGVNAAYILRTMVYR